MNLSNEFESIRDWAEQKGIFEKGDVKTQFVKLLEEVGELSRAILKENPEEFKDAIGDIVIVLTSITELGNKSIMAKEYYEDVAGDGGSKELICEYGDLTIEECINSAYSVIKNRKGQMVNNNFVKNEI